MTTVEPNGDFTITCPERPFGSSGLTVALSYRLYAQSDTGYLLRQLVAVTNPTGAPIDVTGVLSTLYYDGYTGTQGTDGFYTSLGADTVAADDTWFISVDAMGLSVAETNAWALSGSAPAAGIVADNNPSAFFDNDSVFAAGETKYFVTFTNMVIPTAKTGEAAEVAFVASLAQTEEYGSFSGRLVAGLPEGLPVVGWGTTPVTPEPVKPQLADTGSDLAGAPALALGALVLAAGGALLVRSRVNKVREHRS